MRYKKKLFFIFYLLFSYSVSAEQWEWLLEEQVLAAIKLTTGQKSLIKYCKPCQGKPSEIIVKKISAEKMNDGSYRFVLNYVPQDLAYLYYFKGGQWYNIAIALGLKTDDMEEIHDGNNLTN